MKPLPRPNATKRRLLALLAEFFCLRSADAAALLRDRIPTPSDTRSVRRTLAILYRDGFLRRLPYAEPDRERGGVTYVYGLSQKGVRHAFQEGYATPATKTLDEHSVRTLDHELEVTAFHMALRSVCASRGIRYGWRQTGLKHTVHPDALFYAAEPGTRKAFCYFLEVERAKLGQYRDGEPQILRKLRKYYEYFNSTDCEKEWGFRHYRVVVVQRTEARREGLLQTLKQACPHRMFWLTTEAAYRAGIGNDIFQTPKDDAPVRFSFLTD